MIAGNIPDPVHTSIYRVVWKTWNRVFGNQRHSPMLLSGPIPEEPRAQIIRESQAAIDSFSYHDLGEYFKQNFSLPFGFPVESYQIHNMDAGYFVGFHAGLTFVLIRLSDIDTALSTVVDRILAVDLAGTRPPSAFRASQPPELSVHLRTLMNEVAVTRSFVERSLDTPFVHAHFRPAQIEAMRSRWLAHRQRR